MKTLIEFTDSLINSFLGPNKNNKVIARDHKTTHVSRCVLQIFQASTLQTPFGHLIEKSLLEHHNLYGCSSLTLLAMWQFWTHEFEILQSEGLQMHNIVNYSQEILEMLIASLSKISIPFDSFFIPKSYNSGKKRLAEKKDLLNKIPIKICYSSRHLSSDILKDSPFSDVGMSIFDNPQEIEAICSDVVRKLDHDGEDGMSRLVSECWKKQCLSTKSKKFQVDGLLVLSLNIPSSNSAVVDGLVIKSNCAASFSQSVKKQDTHRVLIINGEVAFEYVHLGFSPKVTLTAKKTPENLGVSGKNIWLKRCGKQILQLQVDALIVRDDVDPGIADFCLSHSVLVLPHVPWHILKLFIQASQQLPCSYILDCSQDNVLNGFVITEWKPCSSVSLDNQLFVFSFNPKKEPLQSILLCHPSSLNLSMLKHQIWHLISRLKSSCELEQLLPGGGQVEEFCYTLLNKPGEALGVKNRVSCALANGFLSYSKVVGSCSSDSKSVLDDFLSKISAWNVALQLVFLTLQCDSNIIHGSQNLHAL